MQAFLNLMLDHQSMITIGVVLVLSCGSYLVYSALRPAPPRPVEKVERVAPVKKPQFYNQQKKNSVFMQVDGESHKLHQS